MRNGFHVIDAHCHIYPEKIAHKAALNISNFYDGIDYCGGSVRELLELMEQKNLTLNGLARLSAVPPSTLKNIIYGKSNNPGVVTLKLLCDGMEISIIEFFNSPIFEELGYEEID